MNAQQRFHHCLTVAQGLCECPDKMPYLCVVGTHDFDELRCELMRLEEGRAVLERVSERIATEWDNTYNPFAPCVETFPQFVSRVEQEEFDKIQVGSTPAASPVIAEAESDYDARQIVSQTECLEFCGCKCYRSLNEQRGFWFA